MPSGDVEGAAARLFAHPSVAYIHVRNTEAGCYIARLEADIGDGAGAPR